MRVNWTPYTRGKRVGKGVLHVLTGNCRPDHLTPDPAPTELSSLGRGRRVRYKSAKAIPAMDDAELDKFLRETVQRIAKA